VVSPVSLSANPRACWGLAGKIGFCMTIALHPA